MVFASLITYAQAIVLGLLQGFSELFPISSLGHSVILPGLLGWDIHQNDNFFLTFLVGTHLATPPRARSNHASHVVSAHAGQPDVEHDGVGPKLFCRLER